MSVVHKTNALTRGGSPMAIGLLTLVGVLVAAVFLGGTRLGANGTAAEPRQGTPTVLSDGPAARGQSAITMTDDQFRQWRSMTNTASKRARVMQAFAETFEGVAEVTTADPTEAKTAGAVTVATRNVANVEPVVAYGYNGHFWVTASYADMARGAIWGAVRFCSARLPGWLCTYVGNILTSWARGWGWASNHGVWAAAYWNGTVQGGRW